MTSVLNRRPQLSGSKIGFVLLLPVLLVSCGAFKKIGGNDTPVPLPEEDVVVIDDDKTEDPVPPVKEEVKEVKTKYTSKFFKGDLYNRVPVHNNDFNIVVMLPFHSSGTASKRDEMRSNFMLEYYQGMKLALDKLEDLESKFNITFLDTKNDTSVVKMLLRNRVVEEADLIIGPTDEEQIKMAAYFAQAREIPMFSPITNTTRIWSENNYLYNLSPSPNAQAKEFIRYFKKNHKDKQLMILRDGKKFDKQFVGALLEELKEENINYTAQSFEHYTKWDNFVGEGEFVVLNTASGKTNMTFTVNSLLRFKNRVTLMGPDSWLDFSSVDYKYWEQLNISFISTNKAEVPNKQSLEMYSKFKARYKGEPSWYTYMGYDQLLFSCEVLNAFGKYFPLFLENKKVEYGNCSFNLVKDNFYYDNNQLEIFKFTDYQLINDFE